MRSTRWRKMLRDLRQNSGRAAAMVVTIAVSVAAVGTVLAARSILTREMSRNYLDTRPASATLEIDAADAALAARARALPGISDAEARGIWTARVRVGLDWMPLRLSVINDFHDLRLNTFLPVRGAWPPPEGTMLLEQSAVDVAEASVGDSLLVRMPDGVPGKLAISGLVHDRGFAPAWQERTVYGYVTPATLALLSRHAPLNELRLLVAGTPDAAEIERVLRAALPSLGAAVHEIRIPPPRRHPHDGLTRTVLLIMAIFAATALVLSAVVVATMITSLMARQVREIGIMKALGARTTQIAAMYAATVAAIGVAATTLAIPISIWAARAFARWVAAFQNMTISDNSIGPSVFVLDVAAAVVVPLALAALPIVRGSRRTIGAAMYDYGVTLEHGARVLARVDRLFAMSLRNTLRHRGRTAITLTLLAAGGAIFLTAMNVAGAWRLQLAEIGRTRHYDVEVRLERPATRERVLDALRGVGGIKRLEAWGWAPAAFGGEVSRTYPDGGHGSFVALTPAITALIDFPLRSGRWLRADDTNAVVLNQYAARRRPGTRAGDTIALAIDGRMERRLVVGIVEEIGAAGVAYLSGAPADTRMYRIATTSADRRTRRNTIRAIDDALENAGLHVEVAMPLTELRSAMAGHFVMLINALIALAALVALVGAFGLASSMSIAVVERTRELGVMQAIGGTPAQVMRVFIIEGLVVAAASWMLATLLSLPLSSLLGRVIGAASFGVSLPLVTAPFAVGMWLFAVLLLAAFATAFPARRASRLPVRDALAHV